MDGTILSSKGLPMVAAPDAEGEWTERVTMEGIERTTLVENEAQFTQSLSTPLTVSPKLDDLGLLEVGKAADGIFRGGYSPPEEIDRELENIMTYSECPTSIT